MSCSRSVTRAPVALNAAPTRRGGWRSDSVVAMAKSHVPVVLALLAAVILLVVNTLTHQSTVWAPATTLPQRPLEKNAAVAELVELDEEAARINAQLRLALEKIEEARRM